MSTSTSAFGLAAPKHRSSSRKAIPNHVFGSAAVACLVLGCAWTLYANVFGASVYPQLSSANFDAPVIRRPPALAVRSAPAANDVLAALPEPAPVIAAAGRSAEAGGSAEAERNAAAGACSGCCHRSGSGASSGRDTAGERRGGGGPRYGATRQIGCDVDCLQREADDRRKALGQAAVACLIAAFLCLRRCQRHRQPWAEPKSRARRQHAALRSIDRRLRYLRAHGLSAGRHQTGSAFGSRLPA